MKKPVKELLDERFADLDAQWVIFNRDLSHGKLKHLRYDEETKTIHLKKSKEDQSQD